jgi:hypothetical protein
MPPLGGTLFPWLFGGEGRGRKGRGWEGTIGLGSPPFGLSAPSHHLGGYRGRAAYFFPDLFGHALLYTVGSSELLAGIVVKLLDMVDHLVGGQAEFLGERMNPFLTHPFDT